MKLNEKCKIRCSLAPPPVFTLRPPPFPEMNDLYLNLKNNGYCKIFKNHHYRSGRLSPTIVSKQRSPLLIISLGILFGLCLTLGLILIIKSRLIRRERKSNQSDYTIEMKNCISQYLTKFFIGKSGSDQTTSFTTPDSFDPLIENKLTESAGDHHEYEQIDEKQSFHHIIYCERCINYFDNEQSTGDVRSYYLPLNCSCTMTNKSIIFQQSSVLYNRKPVNNTCHHTYDQQHSDRSQLYNDEMSRMLNHHKKKSFELNERVYNEESNNSFNNCSTRYDCTTKRYTSPSMNEQWNFTNSSNIINHGCI